MAAASALARPSTTRAGPDVEAALAKAEELGGKRMFGPEAVPGTEIELGQFTDPEGHLIGLVKATI